MPDRVQAQIGEFKDGAASAATAQTVYDNLDHVSGFDAFINSSRARRHMLVEGGSATKSFAVLWIGAAKVSSYLC
jgi:hypothetical protein